MDGDRRPERWRRWRPDGTGDAGGTGELAKGGDISSYRSGDRAWEEEPHMSSAGDDRLPLNAGVEYAFAVKPFRYVELE